MSKTASVGDLKSSIKALVGKFDELIKEAKFDKTAKAAGDVRTMFKDGKELTVSGPKHQK